MDEFAAFGRGFEAAAFEVFGFEAGQSKVVKRGGQSFGQRETGAKSAEVAGAELPEEAAGQHDAAERREQLPAAEARAGQFEREADRGVESNVDDGLAGAGDLIEPLLADAVGRREEPFFVEQALAADLGEGADLAWSFGKFLVSARHGRMKILPKYIIRQTLVTLVFTVGVFTFVLMLAQILKQLSEMLVNRQVGLEIVGWFVLLVLPYVMSFSLPMAMLASVLLVFGRMSADNEITAMRASGVGLGRAAAPVIVVAVAMAAVCFYINTTLAPQCRFQFRTLFLRLATENPMALLEEGVKITDFPGYEIYVGSKKGNLVEDVRIMALDERGNVASRLYAERGTVKADPQSRKLLLDLYKVTGDLRDPKDPTNLRKIRPGTTAERYPIELDIGAAFRQARVARGLQDFSFGELREEIRRLRESGIYPAAALMEAHQRVAAAVACVAFALIGIPLGIKTSRRETSIGIALSLGLALIWYLMLVLANTLRNRPYLYPEAILWTPNLIFECLGVWLLWRVSRV